MNNQHKMSETIKSVVKPSISNIFKIKKIKVDAGSVLKKIVDGTINTIRQKIRYFLDPRQFWQVRRGCVIENVEPFLWQLLKGNVQKTRKRYKFDLI